MNERQIDEKKLDLLKELANIGIGNAVTALSKMLNDEKVEMEVPVATVVPLQDVPDQIGWGETPVAGVYIEASGELRLTILFVLSLESASNLITAALPESSGELDEMGTSALLEIGNILTGSYLNALSFMTNMRLLPAPPEIAVDMAGAIISTVMAEAHIVDEEIVLLKTTLSTMHNRIEGHILILPDHGALDKIFHLLGMS